MELYNFYYMLFKLIFLLKRRNRNTDTFTVFTILYILCKINNENNNIKVVESKIIEFIDTCVI